MEMSELVRGAKLRPSQASQASRKKRLSGRRRLHARVKPNESYLRVWGLYSRPRQEFNSHTRARIFSTTFYSLTRLRLRNEEVPGDLWKDQVSSLNREHLGLTYRPATCPFAELNCAEPTFANSTPCNQCPTYAAVVRLPRRLPRVNILCFSRLRPRFRELRSALARSASPPVRPPTWVTWYSRTGGTASSEAIYANLCASPQSPFAVGAPSRRPRATENRQWIGNRPSLGICDSSPPSAPLSRHGSRASAFS